MSDSREQFQGQLRSIARDLVIIYNDVIKRYQICQITDGSLLLSSGRKHKGLTLLFTIEEENGDYRKPDNRDLMRCVQIVEQSRTLWGMTEAQIDVLADDLDEHDTLKAQKVSEQTEAMYRDAAVQVWNELHGKRRF